MRNRYFVFKSSYVFILLFIVSCCILQGCGSNSEKKGAEVDVTEAGAEVPIFNSDSAWSFIKSQVDFGYRIPGSEAHEACGDYLVTELKRMGLIVTEQRDRVEAFDGSLLPMRNIVGSYAPERGKRILLCAHWDSRPWADNDADVRNHHTPVLGANDGASGVGALLEVARLLQIHGHPNVGIDIIFFDVEDYGAPQFQTVYDGGWCLGSEYWGRNPHVEGYHARFGILLDMVGGKEATFFQEGFSREYAPSVVDKVWDAAGRLGYASFFPKENGGYVTDDHLPVNRLARIPCIDIIPMLPHCVESGFGPTWHTVNDNMEHMDKGTLRAVGQTVLEVIYNEK